MLPSRKDELFIMIKKGITLVETIIVISLLSTIIIITYSFIKTNDNIYLGMSSRSDNSINTRIGMEYIVDRIINSQSIQLIEYSNPGYNASHIRVETVVGNPTNILVIDGERIYIKKDTLQINGTQKIENILRCDTDSQQVVPGIYAFEIWNKGNNLYLITLFLSNPNNHEDSEYPNNHQYSSYAKKRC